MKTALQAVLALPISETIGKAVGGNSLIGVGVGAMSARFVMRSFAGMVALGIVAGSLRYMQYKKEHQADSEPDAPGKQRNTPTAPKVPARPATA